MNLEELKNKGIYKITNILDNKIYIGSAGGKLGFKQRWTLHRNTLNNGKHKNRYLLSAWKKYGEKSFEFKIIEIVSDVKKLIEREQYYLDLYKSYDKNIGYNLSKTAGSNTGFIQSDEAKDKIRKFQKGKIKTIETRNKRNISW